MKKKRLNILYSWLLLICFIAGQYMVYMHQDHFIKGLTKTSSINAGSNKQTVKEKCYLCDAMHHNVAVINTPLYVIHQTAVPHVYKPCEYNFVSLSLVLAAGRAPPVVS